MRVRTDRVAGAATWFFQMGIPADLRLHFGGKSTLEPSLGRDVKQARLKRDAYLVQYRAEFERLRKIGASAESEEASRDAVAVQEAFKHIDPLVAVSDLHPVDYMLTLPDGSGADMTAMAIYRSGQQPPSAPRTEALDAFLNDFLSKKSFSHEHEAKTRRAVAKLAAWLQARGKQPTLGAMTREAAGDYLVTVNGGAKTQINIAGLLSSYFAWLHEPRGRLDANPFEGLAGGIDKSKQAPIKKRPFEPHELAALLSDGKSAMLETIRVLALSGMRASELCSLTARDCRNGIFRVHGGHDDESEDRKGKTKAAKREIPIHSDLAAMIEKRRDRKGKPVGLGLPRKPDLLFPEWHGSAHALGKLFHKHRVARKVDDRKKGERQSRIDLHSLRRWFAKMATDALSDGATGFTPWTLADVMGHDTKSSLPLPMTMSLYPGPSNMDKRRACVESVKLP